MVIEEKSKSSDQKAGKVAQDSRVLIIIPAYNEETNIVQVIGKVRSYLPEADILVINDGSKDDTAYLAQSAGAHVVSHPFNMGYGVACQTGFKYACRQGYDYIIQMDGDGQHEPACIPDLLDAVKDPDVHVVLGSRWLGNSIKGRYYENLEKPSSPRLPALSPSTK